MSPPKLGGVPMNTTSTAAPGGPQEKLPFSVGISDFRLLGEKYRKYQGKLPVIFLSFSEVRCHLG